MNNYTWEYIQKNPEEVKLLLGIDFDKLEQLIEQGKFLHQKKQKETEKREIRMIKAAASCLPKLSLDEQIILTLVYLRHHVTFQVLGLLFQVSESTAYNLFNYWQMLFREELPASPIEQVKKYPKNEKIIREELRQYDSKRITRIRIYSRQ